MADTETKRKPNPLINRLLRGVDTLCSAPGLDPELIDMCTNLKQFLEEENQAIANIRSERDEAIEMVKIEQRTSTQRVMRHVEERDKLKMKITQLEQEREDLQVQLQRDPGDPA